MNKLIKDEIIELFWDKFGGLYLRESSRRSTKSYPKKRKGVTLSVSVQDYGDEEDGNDNTRVNGIMPPLNMDYIIENNLIITDRKDEYTLKIVDGNIKIPNTVINIGFNYYKKYQGKWMTTGWAIGDYICFEKLSVEDIEYIKSGKLTEDLNNFCINKRELAILEYEKRRAKEKIRDDRVSLLRGKLRSKEMTKAEALEYVGECFNEDEKGIINILTK